MSTNTTHIEGLFDQLFEGYLAQVKEFTGEQRQQLLAKTIDALEGIMKQQQAPSVPVENWEPHIHAIQLEMFLADKLDRLNQGRTLFARYSPSGVMHSSQFRAAVAQLGLLLTDKELQLFVSRYPGKGPEQVSYDAFLAAVTRRSLAQPPTEQSTQFSRIMAGRAPVTSAVVGRLVAEANSRTSAAQRAAKGLAQMREALYLHSKSLFTVFQRCQNKKGVVSAPELARRLPDMGFPAGLCSEEELTDLARSYCSDDDSDKDANTLDYSQFRAFAMGRGDQGDRAKEINWMGTALRQVHAAMSGRGETLRVMWNEWDKEKAGSVTCVRMLQGLHEAGVHKHTTSQPEFQAFLGTHTKTPGRITYPEFLRFFKSCKPETETQAPRMKLTDDMSEAQLVKALHDHTKGVSVITVFDRFDINGDGTVSPSEMFHSLEELGFESSKETAARVFACFDANHDGRVSSQEVARLICNPNQISKSKAINVQGVRQAPGGEETGVGVMHSPLKATFRKQLGASEYARPVGQSQIDFMAPPEQKPAPPARTYDTVLHPEAQAKQQAPGRRHVPGKRHVTQAVMDFGNDHGHDASARPAPRASRDQGQMVSFGAWPEQQLAGPSTPEKGKTTGRGRARATPGGNSTLAFSDTGFVEGYEQAVRNPSSRFVKPPNSNDKSIHRPMRNYEQNHKTFKSSVRISHELDEAYHEHEAAIRSSTRVRQVPGGVSQVRIAHDNPDDPAAHTGRSSVKVSQNAGGRSATKDLLAVASGGGGRNSVVGNDSLLNVSSKAKSGPAQPYGSWDGPGHTNQFFGRMKHAKAPAVDVDMEQLKTMADVLHGKGRLKFTFQELAKGKSGALSKDHFKTGVRALKVPLTDEQADALYSRFDQDLDGQLTFSEFARMLSFKQ